MGDGECMMDKQTMVMKFTLSADFCWQWNVWDMAHILGDIRQNLLDAADCTKYNLPDAQCQSKLVPRDSFSFDFTDTVFHLADQKTGATVIINPQLNPDSESMLRDMASDGTPLNEPYSSLRLYDIFGDKNSPLSNGAVVINLFPEPTIYSGKSAVVCREHLFCNRQWSAYSVSRHIDAFFVTASEERGLVSLFKNGEVDIGVTKMRMMARITSAYKAEAAKQSSANDTLFGSPSNKVHVSNRRDEMPNCSTNFNN